MKGPFTGRKMTLALCAILLIAFAPVLSVLASIGVADAFGCTLNEAGTHPCVIGGVDTGEVLAIMFVMGWFGLATLPLGAIALLVWTVVAVVQFVRRKPAIS